MAEDLKPWSTLLRPVSVPLYLFLSQYQYQYCVRVTQSRSAGAGGWLDWGARRDECQACRRGFAGDFREAKRP